MESLAPPAITGFFALAGVFLTLGATALQRRANNRREDRLRFQEHRLTAIAELLNGARRYRHAVLASHALASAESPGAASLRRWNNTMQESFEDYHESVTRASLLVPDSIREHIQEISRTLDALRAVAPGDSVAEKNELARTACEELADSVRSLVAADR